MDDDVRAILSSYLPRTIFKYIVPYTIIIHYAYGTITYNNFYIVKHQNGKTPTPCSSMSPEDILDILFKLHIRSPRLRPAPMGEMIDYIEQRGISVFDRLTAEEIVYYYEYLVYLDQFEDQTKFVCDLIYNTLSSINAIEQVIDDRNMGIYGYLNLSGELLITSRFPILLSTYSEHIGKFITTPTLCNTFDLGILIDILFKIRAPYPVINQSPPHKIMLQYIHRSGMYLRDVSPEQVGYYYWWLTDLHQNKIPKRKLYNKIYNILAATNRIHYNYDPTINF